MKSNIETKMELMERRQAVHANKIQALMLMITVMQIPEKEKNRKILKAVRVSTALLWLLTCVEDLMLMIRKIIIDWLKNRVDSSSTMVIAVRMMTRRNIR